MTFDIPNFVVPQAFMRPPEDNISVQERRRRVQQEIEEAVLDLLQNGPMTISQMLPHIPRCNHTVKYVLDDLMRREVIGRRRPSGKLTLQPYYLKDR